MGYLSDVAPTEFESVEDGSSDAGRPGSNIARSLKPVYYGRRFGRHRYGRGRDYGRPHFRQRADPVPEYIPHFVYTGNECTRGGWRSCYGGRRSYCLSEPCSMYPVPGCTLNCSPMMGLDYGYMDAMYGSYGGLYGDGGCFGGCGLMGY